MGIRLNLCTHLHIFKIAKIHIHTYISYKLCKIKSIPKYIPSTVSLTRRSISSFRTGVINTLQVDIRTVNGQEVTHIQEKKAVRMKKKEEKKG